MYIYWNIFAMHGPMNIKFPNNTSKWQMEFNSAFKGLNTAQHVLGILMPIIRSLSSEAVASVLL
jgi:hypothetical protein